MNRKILNFKIPDLRTSMPIEVDGKLLTIDYIRISGYNIYIKVNELAELILYDSASMKTNYKQFYPRSSKVEQSADNR